MAKRKRWLAATVAGLVVAGGVGGWLLTRGDSSSATTGAMTVQVTSGTVKDTVSASGTIEAAKTADLDFSVSGTVTKVYVDEGDRVRKGQAIARIDDSALVATRDAAAASLTAAEEQLDDDEDADASDVQLAADQTAVVSARATLSDARQDVKDAVLRSTIRGTVASLDLEVGDVVGSGSSDSTGSSGSSGSSGTGASSTASTGSSSSSSSDTSSSSAVTIVSTNRFIVDGTVSADDASKVKKGLQAEITVSGVSDTVYGTVSDVGLVAQASSSGSAVFPVTIEVTGARKDLYAGTSATATITVKQRSDVLTVTSRAIRSDGDSAYVEKVVDGATVKTPVTVGEVYGATTEITKGLKAGDTVEVPGFTVGSGSGERGGSGGGEGFSGGGEGGFPGGGTGGGFPGGGMPGGAGGQQ